MALQKEIDEEHSEFVLKCYYINHITALIDCFVPSGLLSICIKFPFFVGDNNITIHKNRGYMYNIGSSEEFHSIDSLSIDELKYIISFLLRKYRDFNSNEIELYLDSIVSRYNKEKKS
jgi:hypothetical protein